MYYWPSLKLTDYEKQFVDIYTVTDPKTGKVVKPGVLRRSYTVTLANMAQREKGIASMTTIKQVSISRRARIMAIAISGNTDSWRLSLKNSNGMQYTNPTPRGQQYPVASSLIAGSYYNALANGGKDGILANNASLMSATGGLVTDGIGANPSFSPQFMSGLQSFPWIIEPNWVCQPNETLIFQGWDISQPYSFDTAEVVNGVPMTSRILPRVLTITVYAWEFPGMKF